MALIRLPAADVTGRGVRSFKAQDSGTDMSVRTMRYRDILARYMKPSLEHRRAVCDVVVAVAASVKVRQ